MSEPISPDPILETRSLARRFGGLHAVDDVTLQIAPGSMTAIIGPNGAGKSTLFHLMSGFLEPEAGTICFEGKDITTTRAYDRARRGMVRTFQIPKLFERMKVLDNMLIGSLEQPAEHFGRALLPMGWRKRDDEARDRARELLEGFRLAPLAEEYAGALSGGQRKLLELARALMARPRVVLLDEPMAGVNPTLGNELFDHITRVRDETGMTVVFVEHDMKVVMGRSERVIVLANGKLISDGTPDEVRADKRVIDAYLGGSDAG